MERFSVSGLDLSLHYTTETKLGIVFRDIEKDLQADKKVVCQYIVNGYSISEEEEEHFAALSLKEVTTFEYLAEDLRGLVKGVLVLWMDAIPELLAYLEVIKDPKNGYVFLDQVRTLTQSMISIEEYLGDSWLAATTWHQEIQQLQKTMVQMEIWMSEKQWSTVKEVFHRKFSESLRLCLKSFGELDTLLDYGEVPKNDPLDKSPEGH